MSRYIDLDDSECVYCGNDGDYEKWNIPDDMPTADVVHVVRCRDCKYFKQDMKYLSDSGCGTCSRVGEGLYLTNLKGYCYLGEKVTE